MTTIDVLVASSLVLVLSAMVALEGAAVAHFMAHVMAHYADACRAASVPAVGE